MLLLILLFPVRMPDISDIQIREGRGQALWIGLRDVQRAPVKTGKV